MNAKIIKIVVGVVLIVIGAWMVSMMPVDSTIIRYISGGVVAIVGIVLIVIALIKKGAAPTATPPSSTPPQAPPSTPPEAPMQ